MKRNREIYAKHKQGQTIRSLAKEYDLTTETVSRIIGVEENHIKLYSRMFEHGDLPSVEKRMIVYFGPKYEDTDMEKHVNSIIRSITRYYATPKEPSAFTGWFLLLDESDMWHFRNIGKKKWKVVEEMQDAIRDPAVSKTLTNGCEFVSHQDYLMAQRRKEKNQNGI